MSLGYDDLLQEMLEKVPSDVDKREGSIIYDALAPCAYFLAQQNFQMEHFIDLVFPDTAVGEYLDRIVLSYGLKRKEATASVRKMKATAEVSLGTRWGINNLVYVVTDRISPDEAVYEVTCEMAGDIGNQYSGALQPISNVTGVSAELTDIITAGTDLETDEALRERLYTKVRLPATSGNAYHYQQWALEVPGAGDAKVFPLADGPGTVTILVIDSNKEISRSLPEEVAAYIETVRPIGATVTVKAPETVNISITANILLDGSRSREQITEDYKKAADQFLKDTIFDTYRISHAKLGSLLLDVPGVEDFEDFLLNSSLGNVTIGEKQIPVLGDVVLTEVSTFGTD